MHISSLRNKFSALCEILKKATIHMICIDETKLDNSFPDSLFKIDGYQFSIFRQDRNVKGDGKIVFIRHELIFKKP